MSDYPETIGEALIEGQTCADGQPLTTSTAQALLAHVTGRGRSWLFAHREEALSEQQAARYLELLERAADGEPLAHLTGEREFLGLPFIVTPDVLVPRPETEAVVEAVLAWVGERTLPTPRIIDVGTGSGAIATACAVKLPNARITATDISPEALDIARRNAERHGVAERVNFVVGDLLEPLYGRFDVITANLPYINREELSALDVGRWEPRIALDGGEDGLRLIRQLLEQAPQRLALVGGLLVLEIGHDQGERVEALCQQVFPGAQIHIQPDLAKLDRIVTIKVKAHHG